MKHQIQRHLALCAGALLLGSLATTTVLADPIASAESVVSFENFTINWVGATRQVDAATDFTSLSVTSSQLTAANMTGMAGVSMNPSSSMGTDLVAVSTRGTVDPAITGIPGTTATTVFNVPSLPLTGNFSASASNETGSPITNFFASASPADLHNASYASLDTLTGTAGTSSSSTLASTTTFVSAVGGDSLSFNFDVGAYIGAFLSTGAAQSASAGWDVTMTLIDTTLNSIAAFFTQGDTISNNDPGTGTTIAGALNSTLTGDIVDVAAASFLSAPIIAGNVYQLTAIINTRTQVERAVPEPGPLSLLAIALLGFAAVSRKGRKESRMVC